MFINSTASAAASRSPSGSARAARGLGKVEHITVSPREVDRVLDESALRVKCRTALFDRGVEGGTMIFHGYRIAREDECLVWSPHYHTLGVIRGGFDRCRDCVHEYSDCDTCDDFKGREVRGFKEDGYLVKVHEERASMFGTAWYQLHHATIKVSFRRFHVVTWFGSMGYRKFKGETVGSSLPCPVCDGEMEAVFYDGDDSIVRDVGNPAYKRLVLRSEFDEHGDPNFRSKG